MQLQISCHVDPGRNMTANMVDWSCTFLKPILCVRRRKAALQARLAREGARIAAAAGRQGERQEAAWGDATSDEDEAEMARYSRERGQILEVGPGSQLPCP